MYRYRALGLTLGVMVALAVVAPRIEAQNCRKGIPCGNSCISASKVCRIGSGTARSAAEPMTPPAPPVTPTQLAPSPEASPAPREAQPPPTTEAYPWIGSFADGIYFRAGCPAALDLAPPNRRYFASEPDARNGGYRRSRVPGC